MVRLGPFMAGSDLVILVGCLTAFMAGVFGFFQADLKRVIAFSTCSQLGCPQNISISNLNWSADPYVAPLRSQPGWEPRGSASAVAPRLPLLQQG